MPTLRNHIEIARPVEDVYTFLSTFENIPLWNYYVLKVEPLGAGEDGMARYRQIRKNDEQRFRVLEQRPPERIRLETLPGSRVQFRRELTLSATPAGHCRVDDHFEVDSGAPGLMQRLFRGKMQSAVGDNLGKLKELLETGETRLQDGRRSRL